MALQRVALAALLILSSVTAFLPARTLPVSQISRGPASRMSMKAEQLGRVTFYMRDGCPFCAAAKELLEGDYDMDVTYVNIWEGSEEEQKGKVRQMTMFSGGRQTVPQIFFNAEHLGGNDDVQTLHSDGKLADLVEMVRTTDAPRMREGWYHPHY